MKMTNDLSAFRHYLAKAVKETVDHADVKNFPKAFARADVDRIDNRSVVNLVNVVFVLQNSRHLEQWPFAEDEPTDSDSQQGNQDRNDRQDPLHSHFFRRVMMDSCRTLFAQGPYRRRAIVWLWCGGEKMRIVIW